MKEELSTLVREFFTRMQIQLDSITVETEDEERNIFWVNVQSPDSKILIGIHGQTLEHLSHLLTRMAEKKFGKHAFVKVEINDYLKSKEERLYRYIDTKIAEAWQLGTPVRLNHLTAYERKQVHSYVQGKNLPGLEAFSEGEGAERIMKIVAKKIESPQSESGRPESGKLESSMISNNLQTRSSVKPSAAPQATSYKSKSTASAISALSEDGIGI